MAEALKALLSSAQVLGCAKRRHHHVPPMHPEEPSANKQQKGERWCEHLSRVSTAVPSEWGATSRFASTLGSNSKHGDISHLFGRQLTAEVLREHSKRARLCQEQDIAAWLCAFKQSAAKVGKGDLDAVDDAFDAHMSLLSLQTLSS